MARSTSNIRRIVLLWALLALITGLVAAVMVAVAGPLYKHEAIQLGTAFGLLRQGAWVGVAAVAAAVIGVIGALLIRHVSATLVGVLALALGLGSFAWPWMMLRHAEAVPPIHDISTNTAHPPRFLALAQARAKAPNGLDYGGGGPHIAKAEVASLAKFLDSPAGRKNPQHESVAKACTSWSPACLAAVQDAYYPGIRPLPAPGIEPATAYGAALATARDMGWKIAASDADARHIEASATTAWFGFTDDIAINVMPVGSGSVVNVRSESRLGLSDLGKNAARVREYLNRLAHRLNQIHAR
ncbi:MAG: DUF1499 domain-containing protein [Gammaproteobacteria bacterium]